MITAITNAQNKTYWHDDELDQALTTNDDQALVKRKKNLKHKLFKTVANQTGKLFDQNVLTIVWARRFAGYKRANLILSDFNRFLKIATNKKYPVQMIWAGKPYPEDFGAINIFNEIFWKTRWTASSDGSSTSSRYNRKFSAPDLSSRISRRRESADQCIPLPPTR